MRVTVSHNQPKQEVIQRIDRGLDEIFKSATGGFVQITDEQRSWVGDQLTFAFNARAAFMTIPVKGSALVQETLVTIDIEMPEFVNNFFPEQKMAQGIESQVRGLLT
jgi:hypothetical protein